MFWQVLTDSSASDRSAGLPIRVVLTGRRAWDASTPWMLAFPAPSAVMPDTVWQSRQSNAALSWAKVLAVTSTGCLDREVASKSWYTPFMRSRFTRETAFSSWQNRHRITGSVAVMPRSNVFWDCLIRWVPATILLALTAWQS